VYDGNTELIAVCPPLVQLQTIPNSDASASSVFVGKDAPPVPVVQLPDENENVVPVRAVILNAALQAPIELPVIVMFCPFV
jgi:hypothetical protein